MILKRLILLSKLNQCLYQSIWSIRNRKSHYIRSCRSILIAIKCSIQEDINKKHINSNLFMHYDNKGRLHNLIVLKVINNSRYIQSNTYQSCTMGIVQAFTYPSGPALKKFEITLMFGGICEYIICKSSSLRSNYRNNHGYKSEECTVKQNVM